MQVLRAPVQGSLLGRCHISTSQRFGVILRANVDDRSKVVREYREDSGEVVVPGEQKKGDNAIYVDQVTSPVSPLGFNPAGVLTAGLRGPATPTGSSTITAW